MKKSMLLLAAACSVAFAPAAFAAQPQARQPVTAAAEFRAPAPRTASTVELTRTHETAAPADQAKVAGRMSGYLTIIIVAVVVGAAIAFSG